MSSLELNLMEVSVRLTRIKIFQCSSCDCIFHSSDRLINHRQLTHHSNISTSEAVIISELQEESLTDSEISGIQDASNFNIELEDSSENRRGNIADIVYEKCANGVNSLNDKTQNLEREELTSYDFNISESESAFYNGLFDSMVFIANHPDWANFNQLPKPSDLVEILQETNGFTLSEIFDESVTQILESGDIPEVNSNFIEKLIFIPGLKKYEEEQALRSAQIGWYNRLFASKEFEPDALQDLQSDFDRILQNRMNPPDFQNTLSFKCKICFKQFLSGQGLQKHMQRKHQKILRSSTVTEIPIMKQPLEMSPVQQRWSSGASTAPALSGTPLQTRAVEIPVHSPSTSATGGHVMDMDASMLMRDLMRVRSPTLKHRIPAPCQVVQPKKYPNSKKPKEGQGHKERCLLCKKKFTKHSLTRHLLQFHFAEEEKLFERKICKSQFSSQKDLKEHQTSTHEVRAHEASFQCSICQAGFPMRWLCTEHENLHHKGTNFTDFVRDRYKWKT